MPVEINFGTGFESLTVPIAAHPASIVLPMLSPPTIMFGFRQNHENEETFFAIATLPTSGAMSTKPDFGVRTTARYNGIAIAQLLAKIAHGYAIGKLGLGTFKPLLPEIILTRPDVFPHDLVGGLMYQAPASESHLHELSISESDGLVVVRIRLFASLEMPVYKVVVAER